METKSEAYTFEFVQFSFLLLEQKTAFDQKGYPNLSNPAASARLL
jgi:hypothetical protein